MGESTKVGYTTNERIPCGDMRKHDTSQAQKWEGTEDSEAVDELVRCSRKCARGGAITRMGQ